LYLKYHLTIKWLIKIMKSFFQVLSENERHRVHESTLDILETTGVRFETDLGRQIMKEAGALVDDNSKIVKFPKTLVESSLKLMGKDFSLGARRPGADLILKEGNSTLCPDGGGTMVLDSETGERRLATYTDWEKATRLADAVDEVGMYWGQVRPCERGDTTADEVDYWCRVFRIFSKHAQIGTDKAEDAPWFLEILQTIFGSKETIRKSHPVSALLCPMSPLAIDKIYTEAYLALKGWNIPAAIMPMPLMGASSPGNMISTIIQGNCEIIAMVCLLQANEPGVPIIYAPALAVMNPKTVAPAYASMEFSIMDAAATEMARYYGIPAETSPGGSDAHVLNTQNTLEIGTMSIPALLSCPDIVVGPGLLDGSMVASLEKFLIDVEVFRLARHAQRGVNTSEEMWLTDVIKKIGPGGNFLYEKSTVEAIRSDDWYVPDFGSHESYDSWVANGKKDILEEARERVNQILKSHEPLPLGDDVEKELAKICKRAAAVK
jgi:trimethylamine---corrinoid protein Co-methyltransferase